MAQSPPSQEAYFYNFTTRLMESPVIIKHFRDIERGLDGLDTVAWESLREEVRPLLGKRHETRGWQALFDKLNEAKGYNYLNTIGCIKPRFIPRSSKSGKKTPDLQATLQATQVLCEVKTINISDNEARRRKTGGVGKTLAAVDDNLLKKLEATLTTANEQMRAFEPGSLTKNIIYVVVNFDDSLHEYADECHQQIEEFVARLELAEVEIVFDIKPKFYSATR